MFTREGLRQWRGHTAGLAEWGPDPSSGCLSARVFAASPSLFFTGGLSCKHGLYKNNFVGTRTPWLERGWSLWALTEARAHLRSERGLGRQGVEVDRASDYVASGL